MGNGGTRANSSTFYCLADILINDREVTIEIKPIIITEIANKILFQLSFFNLTK